MLELCWVQGLGLMVYGLTRETHFEKEELGLLAMADRSPERMQALAMIGLQIQDLFYEASSTIL